MPGDLDRSNLNRTEKTIRIDLLQQQQSHHLRGGADGKRSMCCPLCVYKDRHSTGHRLGKPETVATFLYVSILIVFFLFSALLLRFIFLFIHSFIPRQVRRVDAMGAWSSRKRPGPRFSSILVLLCATLGEHVCTVRADRWNTACRCWTLLAVLCLCHNTIDIGGVRGGRIFRHYIGQFSTGE